MSPSLNREMRLWAGVLVAPAAWGLSLLVSYAVVAERCSPVLTLVLTVVSAIVAAGGAALAVREHRRLAGGDQARGGGDGGGDGLHASGPHHATGGHDRQLLMGKAGSVLGILMVVAILAHGISLFIIGCR